MNSEVYEILGLQANPFPPGACKDFYFQTEATRKILDDLQYGVTARKGFAMLAGEVGLGKTSLLLQLKPRLEEQGVRTAWVFNTLLNKTELLAAIARDYGMRIPDSPHLAELLDSLHSFFLETHKKGQNCAILIDEAHLLDVQAMEVLRMLSNLEVGGEKLVQIVLSGQPELKQKLEQPELRQLRSRINLFRELPPLTPAETGEYVNFKLSSVGSDLRLEGRPLKILRTVSGGNCRRINLLMEKALYALVARGEHRLSSTVLLEGLKEISAWDADLGGKLRRLQLRRFTMLLASALGAGLALGLLLMFWQPWDVTPPPPEGDPLAEEVFEPEERLGPAAPAVSKQVDKEKQQPVMSEPLLAEESPAQAPPAEETPATVPEAAQEANAPAKQEQAPQELPAPESDLARAARSFLHPWGLEMKLRSALYDAVRHNKPQQFSQALAQAANPEQLPLQTVQLERKPPERKYKVTAFPWRQYSDFGPAWIAMWRPPVSMKNYAMDVSSPDIVALQEQLDLLGYYRMGIDGKVGPGTWKAVQLFQRDHDLQQTGVPDADTLFWLYHTDKKARPGTAVVRKEEPPREE